MPETPVRVRFAPSPTGVLHIGSVRTALYNWLFARHEGGKLVLRIEDTDQERGTPEALESVFGTLRWLGLDWDEGPDVGGPYGPYMQSQRLPIYQEAAARLLEQGAAYRCFCTQEDLARMRHAAEAAGRVPRYDGRCRELDPEEAARRAEAGESCVLRFRMPDAERLTVPDLIRGEVVFEAREFDDFIIVKSGGFPVYNFANVVDDAGMKMTHVIRGEDLLPSTPRQLVLYGALGFPPPQFAHAPMLLTPERRKLSKRDLPEGALAYRDEGYLPGAVVNFLSLLGWSPGDDREVFSLEEIVQAFSVNRISPAPAVFDKQKMEWLNAQHLKRTPGAELAPLVRERMVAAGLLEPAEPTAEEAAYLVAVIDLMKERARTLNQLVDNSGFFFTEQFEFDEVGVRKRLLKPEGMDATLAQLAESLEGVAPWTAEAVEVSFRASADAQGVAHGTAIHGTRVAVTGQTVGPGLFELLAVLGRDRTTARLRATADKLRAGALGTGPSAVG